MEWSDRSGLERQRSCSSDWSNRSGLERQGAACFCHRVAGLTEELQEGAGVAGLTGMAAVIGERERQVGAMVSKELVGALAVE
eukprot:1155522-Pelagomonas_calceolata.AAC.1